MCYRLVLENADGHANEPVHSFFQTWHMPTCEDGSLEAARWLIFRDKTQIGAVSLTDTDN